MLLFCKEESMDLWDGTFLMSLQLQISLSLNYN